MRRRNAEGFTKHEQVADWYSNKFLEMQGSWHVPDEEIDGLLDMIGMPTKPEHPWQQIAIELGCGDGKLMARVLNRKCVVLGVDISAVARTMTRERLPESLWGNWDVIGYSMENLKDIPNAIYDYALSYGSMEHALDIPAAVREMARVLKSEGRFLLYVPNEEWIHEDQPLETTASANEWVSLLNQCGLVVDRVKKVNDNNIIVGHKP